MAVFTHKFVSTPEALASSIDTDQHVLRWFTYLVAQHSVQSRFRNEPAVRKFYHNFKKAMGLQCMFSLLLLGTFILLVVTKHYFYFLGLSVFIFCSVRVHLVLKNCVREISMSMILRDFEDSILRKKTLYQVSEFYSRRHHIPSLVDYMFAWDNIWRMTLIAAAFAEYPMLDLFMKLPSISYFPLYCSVVFYLIFAAIYAYIIYKHLYLFRW